jgi:hypothetical protein
MIDFFIILVCLSSGKIIEQESFNRNFIISNVSFKNNPMILAPMTLYAPPKISIEEAIKNLKSHTRIHTGY